MARKAKEQKHNDKQEASIDEAGFYYLPKALLMEWRAMDAECRTAHLSLRVATQELDALLAEQPAIKKKMAEKASMISEAANKKNALVEVHHTIEQIYNVKITDIAIDDVTGRLHILAAGKPTFEEDGKPVMLRPEPVVRPKSKSGRKAKTAT